MEVLHDKKGMIRYKYDSTHHFRSTQIDAEGVPCSVPATAEEMSEESVRLVCQSKAVCAPRKLNRSLSGSFSTIGEENGCGKISG